jgi:hypothetical protein
MGTPVLFLLMRNDLASMNTGKAIAQGSHASNAFTHHFHRFSQEVNARPVNISENLKIINGFNEWENSTSQGFGTVLTLEAKMAEIKPVVDIFKAMNYIAGIVHDPTYPIVDGEIVHHIPLDTCAYVFVPNKEEDQIASMLMKKFPLHR